MEGVGTSQQWEEWTGFAYHIRRRLNQDEESKVGPAIDIRGSIEADMRLNRVRHILGMDYSE